MIRGSLLDQGIWGRIASSNPEPRQANDRRTKFALNGPSATAHAEPRRFLRSLLVVFRSLAKGQIGKTGERWLVL